MSSIQAHIGRRDNPHQITKEQIELGNIHSFGVATPEDIVSLSASDLYIPANSGEAIRVALVSYLTSLDLIDENGNLIPVPIDKTGLIQGRFYQDELRLEGTRPTASFVDVVIKLDGVELHSFMSVPLNNQYWSIDTAGLGLNQSNTYEIIVFYKDGSDERTGYRIFETTTWTSGTHIDLFLETGITYYDMRRYEDLSDEGLIYIDLNEDN